MIRQAAPPALLINASLLTIMASAIPFGVYHSEWKINSMPSLTVDQDLIQLKLPFYCQH